jgi:hypothetical protein
MPDENCFTEAPKKPAKDPKGLVDANPIFGIQLR